MHHYIKIVIFPTNSFFLSFKHPLPCSIHVSGTLYCSMTSLVEHSEVDFCPKIVYGLVDSITLRPFIDYFSSYQSPSFACFVKYLIDIFTGNPGWNRRHHSQTINPKEKLISMNLFKILWVATWAWLLLTSMVTEAVRGQESYSKCTLWHFNSSHSASSVSF